MIFVGMQRNKKQEGLDGPVALTKGTLFFFNTEGWIEVQKSTCGPAMVNGFMNHDSNIVDVSKHRI